jgi:hypothetical protein
LSFLAVASTRSRVSGMTAVEPANARETVASDKPVAAAMVPIVAFLGGMRFSNGQLCKRFHP